MLSRHVRLSLSFPAYEALVGSIWFQRLWAEFTDSPEALLEGVNERLGVEEEPGTDSDAAVLSSLPRDAGVG